MKHPTLSLERKLWKQGFSLVCGLDEVGRGAWAGPLYAAAVVFPKDARLNFKLSDSKKLTPKKREELSFFIKRKSQAWELGFADVSEIEEKGVSFATEKAMLSALEKLGIKPDFCLIDFLRLKGLREGNQMGIKYGDQICASVAAASILAKVGRDKVMVDLAKDYLGYGFEKNKGYGTRDHQHSIRRLGLTPIHRKSFVPKDLYA